MTISGVLSNQFTRYDKVTHVTSKQKTGLAYEVILCFPEQHTKIYWLLETRKPLW